MLRSRCVSFRFRCGRPVAEALFGPTLDCCLGRDGGRLDPMEGEEDEVGPTLEVLMRGGGGGCIFDAVDGGLVVVEVAMVICLGAVSCAPDNISLSSPPGSSLLLV